MRVNSACKGTRTSTHTRTHARLPARSSPQMFANNNNNGYTLKHFTIIPSSLGRRGERNDRPSSDPTRPTNRWAKQCVESATRCAVFHAFVRIYVRSYMRTRSLNCETMRRANDTLAKKVKLNLPYSLRCGDDERRRRRLRGLMQLYAV